MLWDVSAESLGVSCGVPHGGDGNVYWLSARRFRLFFQDVAPKAG